KDDVVVAVILQADVTLVGARATLGLEIEFFRRNGLAFCVIGDSGAVEDDDRARAIERDEHGVPFGAGLAGPRQRLGERVKCGGHVILVLVGFFGLVVNLHLVAVVDRHPGFAGLDGDANEDAGVVVVVA